VKQGDSKLDSSKASHLPDASSDGTVDSASHKNDSLNANFTAQVASPFALQGSTVQPEQGGMFFSAPSGSDGADKISQSESTEQSASGQPNAGISGLESGQQSDASTQVPIGFPDAPTSLCKRGAGEGPAPADLLAAGSAGLPGLTLASADPAATLDGGSENAAQLSTIGNGDLAQALDEASTSLTSSAAKARMVSAITSGFGNSLKPTAKMNQSTSNGSVSGLNSSVGDATKSGKDANAGDAGSLLHSSVGAGSQISAVQVRGSEVSALQPIIPASQATVHGSTGTTAASGSTGMETHRDDGADNPAMERWMGGDSAGMSGISTAQIIQNMSESVMRVGMHSSEFGDISIRTSVSQQEMQTQIAVDHNGLGSALAAHIPSVQAKLGSDYGLHANIQVNQGGASFSDARDGTSQQQKNSTAQPVQVSEVATATQEDTVAARSVTVASSDYRLDIRA
jgi:hypothetical protein